MFKVDKEQLAAKLNYWGSYPYRFALLQGLSKGEVHLQVCLLDGGRGRVYADMGTLTGESDSNSSLVAPCGCLERYLGNLPDTPGMSLESSVLPGCFREGRDVRETRPGSGGCATHPRLNDASYCPESGAFILSPKGFDVVYVFLPAEAGSTGDVRALSTLLFGDASPLKHLTGDMYMTDEDTARLAELRKAGCPDDELAVKQMLLEAGDETPVPFERDNKEAEMPAEIESTEDAAAVSAGVPDTVSAAPPVDLPAGPGTPVEKQDEEPVGKNPPMVESPPVMENVGGKSVPSLGDEVAAEDEDPPMVDSPKKPTDKPIPVDILSDFRDGLRDALVDLEGRVAALAEELAVRVAEKEHASREGSGDNLKKALLDVFRKAIETVEGS